MYELQVQTATNGKPCMAIVHYTEKEGYVKVHTDHVFPPDAYAMDVHQILTLMNRAYELGFVQASTN